MGIVAVVGFPERAEDVYNAAAVLADGAVHASTARSTCPTTASSTRSATSSAGGAGAVIEIGRRALGVTICEDIWEPGPPGERRGAGGRRR